MKRQSIRHRMSAAFTLFMVMILVCTAIPVRTGAASKTKVVASQKTLEKALNSGDYTTIKINHGKTGQFTIPANDYSGITVYVAADGIKLQVSKGAKLKALKVTGKDNIVIVNDGDVKKVSVKNPDGVTVTSTFDYGEYYSDKIGFITQERTIIESKYLTFDIEPNVYVVPNMVEIADIICEAMEAVTGRSFTDCKYNEGKIVVYVSRGGDEDMLVENAGRADGEKGCIHITPLDLFVEGAYAFTHELGHAFNRLHVDGFAGMTMDEGFTTYTELKICEYLAENYPDIAVIQGTGNQVKRNMKIQYNRLYAQTVEYWMNHQAEAWDICTNGQYGVGFRLMGYLEEVYGDYTKWFETYDSLASAQAKKQGIYSIDGLPEITKIELSIEALQKTYGKKVLTKFYTWLKNNEAKFDKTDAAGDFSKASEAVAYPCYYWCDNYTFMGDSRCIIYNNLTVYIAPTVYYLKEYKGEDVSRLVLRLSSGTTVERYGYDGMLIDTVTGNEISLTGVAAIKLIGEGETYFEIIGYKSYNMSY